VIIISSQCHLFEVIFLISTFHFMMLLFFSTKQQWRRRSWVGDDDEVKRVKESSKLNDEEEKKKLQTTMTYGLNYYYGLNNRSFLLALTKHFILLDISISLDGNFVDWERSYYLFSILCTLCSSSDNLMLTFLESLINCEIFLAIGIH
jgi:hypothetical protein